MRVQLVSSRKYGDYVLRRFTLSKRSNGVAERKGNQTNRTNGAENEICREIVQFHMQKWREYVNSGEQPSWLLCFIGKINEYVFDNHSNSQISSGPLLVHCEVSRSTRSVVSNDYGEVTSLSNLLISLSHLRPAHRMAADERERLWRSER